MIKREICIGDGICKMICPEVFMLDEDGVAVVISTDNADSLRSAIQEAANACPTEAILLVED